jgi:hypothetical protein
MQPWIHLLKGCLACHINGQLVLCPTFPPQPKQIWMKMNPWYECTARPKCSSPKNTDQHYLYTIQYYFLHHASTPYNTIFYTTHLHHTILFSIFKMVHPLSSHLVRAWPAVWIILYSWEEAILQRASVRRAFLFLFGSESLKFEV